MKHDARTFQRFRSRRAQLGQTATEVNAERAAEINLHTVARDNSASEPIHAGIVIKLRFSVTGAPAVTKLQVMSRVTQQCPASSVPYVSQVAFKTPSSENDLNFNYVPGEKRPPRIASQIRS